MIIGLHKGRHNIKKYSEYPELLAMMSLINLNFFLVQKDHRFLIERAKSELLYE